MTREGSIAPLERVRITYRPPPPQDEDVELPLKILVLGDYTRRPDERPLEDRQPIRVTPDNFNDVLAAQKLELNLAVPDKLSPEPDAETAVNLKFKKLADFTPEGIANQVPELRKLLELRQALDALRHLYSRGSPSLREKMRSLLSEEVNRERLTHELGLIEAPAPNARETTTSGPSSLDTLDLVVGEGLSDEARAMVKVGMKHLLTELLRPGRQAKPSDRSLIETMVREIDARLSAQVDAILHHADFMKLESSWRGLKYLVDRVDFRENLHVELLNVSKEDLLNDFEDAPRIERSGLYKLVYPWRYMTYGVMAYSLIVGGYEFAGGHQDVMLLQRISELAAMAHAPFLASASPRMFGIDSWEKLHDIKSFKDLFEGPQYARWQSFRESEDARYVGLTASRFLLRLPYGADTAPVKAFAFEEDVAGEDDRFLWGSAALALAARAADSFARYRWCPNIVGAQGGGRVEGLPLVRRDDGAPVTRSPVEVPLTEREARDLAEEGFIGLVARAGTDTAHFEFAPSCQKPRYFGQSKQGREAETSYRLSAQLPYVFVTSRLAHYVKMVQNQLIFVRPPVSEEQALGEWLGRLVADTDDPAESVRRDRPLRRASVKVVDVADAPRWGRFELRVQPHLAWRDAPFELSLSGRLDRAY
jgi:type VI secretion system protein ImpC